MVDDNLISVRSTGALPMQSTPGASGYDLTADVDSPVDIFPGERVLVPTGIWLQLPRGWEAQVRPRSGLALRHGVTVLNAPGTIDSDYRGEVKVLLVNHGQAVYTVNPWSRIAQLVFSRVEHPTFQRVDTVEGTKRGDSGFGSTGVY
jgi:dUTP pyrophosphatase